MLYEMLAGEPPFTAPTTQGVIAKLLTQSPVRLRLLRDTVPAGLDARGGPHAGQVARRSLCQLREVIDALAASRGDSRTTIAIQGVGRRSQLRPGRCSLPALDRDRGASHAGVVRTWCAAPVPTRVARRNTTGSYPTHDDRPGPDTGDLPRRQAACIRHHGVRRLWMLGYGRGA